MASKTTGSEPIAAPPGWEVKDGQLTRTYELSSFAFAIEFVRQIGALAEEADHHPDIDIRFNKVTLYLRTHSAKAITASDTDLAAAIDRLLEREGVQ